MLKYIKKIYELLLNFLIIVIVILLILSIYAVFQTSILKKNYFNILGFTIFEVKTGSMSGSIEIGDIIIDKILNENEKDNLKVNDIISFEEENYIVTHRIYAIGEDNSLITKGDANNSSDDPINKENIIGKVLVVIPKVGIFRSVLLDKKVFILSCLTISLFVISFSINKKSNDNSKSNT